MRAESIDDLSDSDLCMIGEEFFWYTMRSSILMFDVFSYSRRIFESGATMYAIVGTSTDR